ncbi:hypothetical protein BVRB_025920 [Beta vulgaris subsp. vulgaris]|uniref:Uncharacterized protein n=1 Tax=Beta vulgaris subsp. vulgaris TaxID=3555 RepID=A0A0J8B274_BETVV|nr:hypothetical protein BVRB_025920 [Beta vulgaris subsp. vulgaris]
MYSKVLAAAIADEQAQFDEYFNNLHMQLQLEALSPHVVPTLVDLYDSSYFDDSELLKKLFTPERLSGKVTEDKYLVKLRQLPLFSNI